MLKIGYLGIVVQICINDIVAVLKLSIYYRDFGRALL